MKNLKGSIMLLIAALIWGTTFVAQSKGMEYVEPFTYNAIRMLVGSIVLLPVIFLFHQRDKRSSAGERNVNLKATVAGGIYCGAVLFTASSFQQIGIMTTTAGKSGFITTLYIIIVPIYELIIFRRKKSPLMWLFVLIAVVGFYLLCIKQDFSISRGDFMTLLCAFFFAGHIIVIDIANSQNADGVMMSCIQFFVSGLLAAVAMLIWEHPNIESIISARYTILYAGVFSAGIAYTLQILGQKHTEPTLATLIMSLESVFAALSGWLVLHEQLSLKEGIGCVIVFAAVILAQLGASKKA